MKTKHTIVKPTKGRRKEMATVPLVIKGLPPLRAASDQNVWTALQAMKQRGEIDGKLPEYSAIAQEVTTMGFPPMDNKQISKSIVRLLAFGYIRRREELAA